MKIRVLHHWTPSPQYDRYAELTLLNRRTYCGTHGYELVVDRLDRAPNAKFKHCTKFGAMLDHLDGCDWLVWADVDALFANAETRLEDFADDAFSCVQSKFPMLCHSGFVPVLSQHAYFLHNGVMLMRNDGHTRRMLEWASDPAEIAKVTAAYNMEYMLDEDVSSHAYWSGAFDWRDRVKLLDLSALFSTIPLGRKNDQRLTQFRPGRFVLHLAAPLSHDIKYAVIRNYATLCEEAGEGHVLPLDRYDERAERMLGLR